MNESEEKTRKHWLVASFCFLFFYPVASTALVAIIFSKTLTMLLAWTAVIGLLQLWLIWHCAYKKHGTKLLTFWLFTAPLAQLGSVVIAFKIDCSAITIGNSIVQIGVFLWWYLLSLKLRKFNKAIQETTNISQP
jgi:hypothetical protein